MKKPTVRKPRTLEGRLEVAISGGQRALDVFEGLAQQLETAADAAHEVEADAENEVTNLRNVAWRAGAQEASLRSKAGKIRELFQ